MTRVPLLPLAAVLAGLAASMAAPVWAEDAAPIVTAAPAVPTVVPSTPASPDTTAAQISAWMREGDDGGVQTGQGAEPAAETPRQVHGEVTVGVGSSGYRGVSGIADIPVGRSSDLVVAGSSSQFGGRYGRGGAESLSVGLFLNGAKPSPPACARGLDGAAADGWRRPPLTAAPFDGDFQAGCRRTPDPDIAGP